MQSSCAGPLRIALVALIAVLGGCAGHRAYYREEGFKPGTPYSRRVAGPGKLVCWSVKEAFLSQGYMLRDAMDTAIMVGTKDYQPNDKTDVTLRLQTTCVDNGDGTSTVFATASQSVSKLQKLKQSISAGVSIATVTWPSSSGEALRLVSRRTIQDPTFYKRFYALVTKYARRGHTSGHRSASRSN